MRNVLLELNFDGTLYHGWQRQENAITVQQIIEEKLSQLTKQNIKVTGCGRTDAGVHGLKYICNFFMDFSTCSIPLDRIPVGLNSVLPYDIRAVRCEEASNEFHARYSAKKKAYVYRIQTGKVEDPFLRNYTLHFGYALDFRKMQQGAEFIIGKHDFSSFTAAGSRVIDRVRNVSLLEITKEGSSFFSDEIIQIKIEANGFLYKMVRIITGTLLEIGINKRLPEDIEGILLKKNRKFAGFTAPPQGLYLYHIEY